MGATKEEDKKAIFNRERAILVQWFKTVSEGKLRIVKAMATVLVLQKKVSSVKCLLSELVDGEGHVALHFAANRGFIDICEWILEEAPESLDVFDENGDTALSYACMGNQLETVKFLISKGAKINIVNEKQRCPILVACGKSERSIIECLLDNGASLNIGTHNSVGTPLHWAVGENRVEIGRLLLERGANVNAVNESGVTPLVMACANTNATMITMLLEFHADPTICIANKVSPLHIVCEGGHLESVIPFMTLSEADVLVNAETDTKLKPIHFAAEKKDIAIVEILLKKTTGYEGKTAEEVIDTVVKQIQADKPFEKPVLKLSRGQRKICDKKRNDGIDAFRKKNYENAISLFTAALTIDPYDESLYCNRCAAYLEIGQFKEAQEDGLKTVEISPKWAKAYYRLGMAYFNQGLYVDAASAFYSGCEIAPTNKELSDMFKKALEVGKREHQKEAQEVAEKVQE